jgi:hypothetical protein
VTSGDDWDAEQRAGLHQRVENDHVFHPASASSADRYRGIRGHAQELAHHLIDVVPPGRELSNALTRLEEVVFHANAGIARSQPAVPESDGALSDAYRRLADDYEQKAGS